jgi:hypothetical protein
MVSGFGTRIEVDETLSRDLDQAREKWYARPPSGDIAWGFGALKRKFRLLLFFHLTHLAISAITDEPVNGTGRCVPTNLPVRT